MSEESAIAPAELGVELEQLAAIHVDLDAGFALDEALKTEALERGGFDEGEIAWKVRLAGGGAVFEAYREATAAHQDRIARPVAPLDDDLDAWVIFLRCYQEHRDPFDLLSALGLGFGDVARLGRRWGARLDGSPRLAKRAAKIAERLELRANKHGEKARLPLISVGKPRLLPSPAAMRARRRKLEPVASAPVVEAPELTLDAYAALVAALRVSPPKSRAEVLARMGLSPAEAQALDDVWQKKIADDALLRSDFRVLCRHFEEAAKLRKRGAEAAAQRIFTALELSPARPAVSEARSATAFWTAEALDVNATGTMPALVLERALPFIEERLAALPIEPGESSEAGQTGALIPALLDADVLPFAKDGDLDATGALDPAMLAAEVLPFDDAPLEGNVSIIGVLSEIDFEPVDDHLNGDSPLDGGVLDGDDLDGTSAGLSAFVDEPALPFGRAEPFSAAVEVSNVDPFGDIAPSQRTQERNAPEEDLDGTAVFRALDPSDLDSTTAFVALDLDLEERPPSPRLTLEQYASLTVEIERWPAQAAAILARYGLSEMGDERAAWSPFLTTVDGRARFEGLCAAYRVWLASQGR